jgi:hypothetical protein
VKSGLRNFLIVAGLLLVFVVGCSVLLRSGGNGGETATELGGGGGTGGGAGEAATMTFDQFQAIPLDSTEEQIVEEYGNPTPREEVVNLGIIPDDATTENCIYYKADPPTFGEWFEFCFEGELLRNKTSL